MRYKNKKQAILFLAVSMVLIGSLPLFNFGVDKNIDANVKDLYSTDNLERYRNYVSYRYFDYSFIEDLAIVGENDFLFLGNKHDRIIDQVTGKFRPTPEEVEAWTEGLLRLQKAYQERGVEFVVAIAPNKHSIYSEHLPDKYKPSGQTVIDDLVGSARSKHINLLDLRDVMRDAKDKGLLYWKTDTHWNEKGAAVAFDAVLNHINKSTGLALTAPDYSLEASSVGGGDLANFLKINTLLPQDYETRYNYDFKKHYEVCKGDIDRASGTLGDCESLPNPVVGINTHPQFTMSKNAENNLKLLLLCDSFGTAPSQLYNATFDTVWKWHWAHIRGAALEQFVEQNKPDMVIYQVVERSLYNSAIIDSLH